MSQLTAIARPAAGSPIAVWAEDPQGGLQLTGAEPPLTREEQEMQERVHRFATEVMRPIGQQLDRMTPEEVIAESSPLWSVFKAFSQLGLGVDRMLEFEPEHRAHPRVDDRLLGGHRARTRLRCARCQQADLQSPGHLRSTRLRGEVVR